MKKGLLKHVVFKVILVLIAFFSLIENGDAASFAYDSFDWDTFYNENVNYWTDYCEAKVSEDNVEECVEVTLSGKEKFYTKLYKVLAKHEKQGNKLNDNIIIATAFFYLTPDTFSDLPEKYLDVYKTGEAYGTDNEDVDSYVIKAAESEEEYLKEAEDDLKTLTKNMFSYTAVCNNEDGKKIETYSLTYEEYTAAKLSIWNILSAKKDIYREKCEEQGGKYDRPNGDKIVDYNTYWRYLEESDYFDDKVHLSSFYKGILDDTGKEFMKDLSAEEKEEYADEIKKARKDIVAELKSIIYMYDDYDKLGPDSGSFISTGCSGNAWWPIGSDDVTSEGGITFASGNPISTSVTSPFGPRIHPIKGILSQHTGIDIGGVIEGQTNIIAVKEGTVIYPDANAPTNCPSSSSLDSCGGGYGNFVVIQHADGTHSLYAHLAANSITVSANDTVKQGQVIGKAGSSGNSTGPHLHFEIMLGEYSQYNTVNPLDYVSLENPRSGGVCSSSGSEFLKMLHWFEGSCASPRNGNNYIIHDDGVGIPTVGYGVALVHNIDRFKTHGVDVTNMGIGQELPIDIVDSVESLEIENFRSYVNDYLGKNSITLTEYQVDCLVMVAYQWGDLGNFATMYKEYGNTEALRENTKDAQGGRYFAWNPSTANGRADATWRLFNEGTYTYDSSKC